MVEIVDIKVTVEVSINFVVIYRDVISEQTNWHRRWTAMVYSSI